MADIEFIRCTGTNEDFIENCQLLDMDFYNGQNGTQAGNPKKAAELYTKVAEMDNPPESLPMGTDCCNGIREIALNTARLMDEMQDTASYTDF